MKKIKIIDNNQMVVEKEFIELYERSLAAKNKEIIKLKSINDIAYTKLNELDKKLANLEKNISELKSKYNDTLKDNINLAAEIATLSMERDKLIKSNAGYKGNMVKAQNQLKVLKGGKDGKCK